MLMQGLIMKIIFIVGLVKAVQAATAYQKSLNAETMGDGTAA